MASRRGRINYVPCRKVGGEFATMTACGKKKAPKRKARKTAKRATKKAPKKSKKPQGTFYRDKGGFCRKEGKRGFAKESSCKRAGAKKRK